MDKHDNRGASNLKIDSPMVWLQLSVSRSYDLVQAVHMNFSRIGFTGWNVSASGHS